MLVHRIVRLWDRTPQIQLPVVEFESLFPGFGRARLVLEGLVSHPAGVRVNELLYLAYLAHRLPGAQVFEIGTSIGRTTLNVALNLQSGGHVFSLDLPAGFIPDPGLYAPSQEFEVRERRKGALLEPYARKLPYTLLQGESTSFDFSPWHGRMDLVFLDGGHTRRVVEQDTVNAFRLLKTSGGIILWHDYRLKSCPDVVDFLNQLQARYDLYLLAGTKTVMYCSDPELNLSARECAG